MRSFPEDVFTEFKNQWPNKDYIFHHLGHGSSNYETDYFPAKNIVVFQNDISNKLVREKFLEHSNF